MSQATDAIQPINHRALSALLDHIERPLALCSPQGGLLAFNNLFRHEAEQLGLDAWELQLTASGELEARGRVLGLPLIHSDLGLPDHAPLEWLQGVAAPRASRAGGVAANPQSHLTHLRHPGSVLLQVELNDPGAMRRRLGQDNVDTVLDTIERRLLSTLPEGAALCRTREERLLALIPCSLRAR